MKTVTRFLVLIVILGTNFVLSTQNVSASSLYLDPSAQNFKTGDEFRVNLFLNTRGEEVNALAANLSYPADKLEVESISSSEAFPIRVEQAIKGNTIKLAQGSINPVNGTVSVAAITFKARTAGEAKISFQNGSAAPRFSDSTDSLNLAQSQGTSLNIRDSIGAQEAGPSATPAAKTAEPQTLSISSLWTLITRWFNS